MSDVVKNPILNNKSYDIAKDVVTLYLPALATFYAGVAAIWGLPFSTEIVGTIAALVTLLGVVLKISSNRYANQPLPTDGEIVVNYTDPNSETVQLALTQDQLNELAAKSVVRLAVTNNS